MKHTIMVVDDDKSNLTAAKILLESQYEVSLVNSGIKALRLLEKYIPDLILLDLKMPDMDGFEVIDVMKSNERMKNIPVIILTADKSDETERDCFVHGAVDYIGKPFKAAVMLERVRRSLELETLRGSLELQVQQKTSELEAMILQSITAIAASVDARGAYMKGHSTRVAEYAVLIAMELGWDEEKVNALYHAALLHDIGKIGIPDTIFNKPGKLSVNEMEVIRSHTLVGAEILKDIKSMKEVQESVAYHHERYDGKGYPYGLAGEDIPLTARIVAVADAYDAMTSERVYRSRLPQDKVLAELRNERGRQFDPDITDIILRLLSEHGELEKLYNERQETEEPTDDRGRLVRRVLEKQSETDRSGSSLDWLTGLYNRSFSEREIIRRMREEDGVFFLIDLDNFKMVNDFYGHAAGDAVLQQVADIFKNHAGEYDLASRVGGDEFTIYISGTMGKEEAARRARSILDDFAEQKKKDALLSECSLSIGISFIKKEEDRYIDVYKKADRALYYVKQNGKNGFEFYNESQHDIMEKGQDGITELQRFVRLLDNEKTKKGVYEVGYRELSRTLELVSRFVERNDQELQLVLFSLISASADVDLERQQEAMEILEKAIYKSLRKVDISTRYSSTQHMVVLVDADEAGIEIVARRIMTEFDKNNYYGEFTITYDFVAIS